MRRLVAATPRELADEMTWTLVIQLFWIIQSYLSELSEYQRNRRFEISASLLLSNEKIHFFNRRHSAQWLDNDRPPRQFPKPKSYCQKVMVSVLWPVAGFIHYHFLSPGETIAAEMCSQQIDEMYKKLLQKQQQKRAFMITPCRTNCTT